MNKDDIRKTAVLEAVRIFKESLGDSAPYQALVDSMEKAIRAKRALEDTLEDIQEFHDASKTFNPASTNDVRTLAQRLIERMKGL